MHPELVGMLPDQALDLELRLMSIPTGSDTGGVTSKLETDGFKPVAVLLGAHGDLPHVDIEGLSA